MPKPSITTLRSLLNRNNPIERNSPQKKKGRTPRKLTVRRMERIKEFLKTALVSPERYGEIGSKPWISGLIGSLREHKRNDVIVSDVKNWLATQPGFFRDAVRTTRKDIKDEGGSTGTLSNTSSSSASPSGSVQIPSFEYDSGCEDKGSPGSPERDENGLLKVFKMEKEDEEERNLDSPDELQNVMLHVTPVETNEATDGSSPKHLIPAYSLHDVSPDLQTSGLSEAAVPKEESPFLLFDHSGVNVTINGTFTRDLLHGLIMYLQDQSFLPRQIQSTLGKLNERGLLYDVGAPPPEEHLEGNAQNALVPFNGSVVTPKSLLVGTKTMVKATERFLLEDTSGRIDWYACLYSLKALEACLSNKGVEM